MDSRATAGLRGRERPPTAHASHRDLGEALGDRVSHGSCLTGPRTLHVGTGQASPRSASGLTGAEL